MFKQWIIGMLMDGLKSLIESGKLEIYWESLKEQIIKWLEPTLRAAAARSETEIDDKIVDLVIDALRK